MELLRLGSDRSDYILTKTARIVAMTCTHAALKRAEVRFSPTLPPCTHRMCCAAD